MTRPSATKEWLQRRAQRGRTKVTERSVIWEVDYWVIATLCHWSQSFILCRDNYQHRPCACALVQCCETNPHHRVYQVIISPKDTVHHSGVSPLMPLPFRTHFGFPPCLACCHVRSCFMVASLFSTVRKWTLTDGVGQIFAQSPSEMTDSKSCPFFFFLGGK